MLTKAAVRIENATKHGLRANIELEEEIKEDVQELGEVEDDEFVFADSLCKPKNMLEMLDLLLAFHAWYKRGHPFLSKMIYKIDMLKAIRIMMEQLQKYTPRKDKSEWCLQKCS